jgi:hypothetical protein
LIGRFEDADQTVALSIFAENRHQYEKKQTSRYVGDVKYPTFRDTYDNNKNYVIEIIFYRRLFTAEC